VHHAVVALRKKLNVPDSGTVSIEFEKEYNCELEYNDRGMIAEILFNTDADETMFRLKWS